MRGGTKNPLLKKEKIYAYSFLAKEHESMTVGGTVKKVLLGLLVTCIGVLLSRYIITQSVTSSGMGSMPQVVVSLLKGSFLLTFACAMVTSFKPSWAPYTLFPYALGKGVSLGSLTFFLEGVFTGITLQALLATGITIAVVLLIHVQKIFVITTHARKVATSILISVVLLIPINIVLHICGISSPINSLMYGSGSLGILFSLAMIVLASFFLLDDMQVVEESSKKRLPAYMNDFLAFALLVSIFFLFTEILRLLIKIRKR